MQQAPLKALNALRGRLEVEVEYQTEPGSMT
jgi:hypothetical protein